MLHFHLLVYDRGVVMDTDEELHRVWSGRVLNAGAAVPMELGYVTLLPHGCVHQYGSSSSLILYEFLWRLHYVD